MISFFFSDRVFQFAV